MIQVPTVYQLARSRDGEPKIGGGGLSAESTSAPGGLPAAYCNSHEVCRVDSGILKIESSSIKLVILKGSD